MDDSRTAEERVEAFKADYDELVNKHGISVATQQILVDVREPVKEEVA